MVTHKNEHRNIDLLSRIELLEKRTSRLEEELNMEFTSGENSNYIKPISDFENISNRSAIESVIGEQVLAWLGNFVLFFGLAFFIQYIQNTGYQYAAIFFGYISVFGIFILAYFLRKSFSSMSTVFNLNAYLLLFFVTLKLYFFSLNPIILNSTTVVIMLLVVVAIQVYLSVKHKSKLLGGVALVLLSIISVISNTTHIMLAISVVIAIISVYYLYLYGWIKILYVSIILTYTVNLIWFFNNPIMGNPLQAVVSHNFGTVYIFFIGLIFSLIALVNKSTSIKTSGIVISVILNGLFFSSLLLLYVITFFIDDYIIIISSISVFCILYSIILKIRSNWKITAAFYALYGFITFSIAVHGIYGFPQAFFMLAIQSLLVVSMAIWFRSRFIVIMNTLLFLFLLIFYLIMSNPTNGINISFAIVALLTARILNWKKDRLTIKTDLLRNIYLLTAFVMVLVTLYFLIPQSYITLSWTVAAVTYFVLSMLFNNVKYRYMALGTMIAATIYLFIIDLSRIELVFRIIALMFLAIISIGLSIYYSRKNKRSENN